MSRLVAWTLLLFCSLAGLQPVARADEATNRNLLERGMAELQEAQRLYFSGRRDAARLKAQRAARLFEQVDTQREADAEAAFLLIQAAVFAGDSKAAARWLETYGSRNPYGARDSRLFYARGLIQLLLERRSAAAVASLEQMQRLDGRKRDRGRDTLYYQALMMEGARRIEERKAAEAVPILQRAARTALRLGDRRKELTARSNVGIAWQLSGRAEEARQVFEPLTKEDAESPVWPYHLGLALDALDRPAEAAGAYELAVARLDEERLPASMRSFLRQAYLRKGYALRLQAETESDADVRRAQLEAARASFEKYVLEAPKDARGHAALGAILYESFARPYEALPHLETAHALDPVCDRSLELLIELARRHGPPDGSDAKAQTRWTARREAWEADYATHREARARDRAARARRSLEGSDGCR